MASMGKQTQVTVGLALAGGGARGLAHIGVLQALRKANIHVDMIAGTSFGGFIGACHALGKTPDEIQTLTESYATAGAWLKLIDLRRRCLLSEAGVTAFFESALGAGTTFADLKIPLCLTATDLTTGREAVLAEGALVPAVRATTAIPGVVPPATIGERLYVDGAVVNNLPVDLPRKMGADIVIGVDTAQTLTNLDHIQDATRWASVPRSLKRSLQDMERSRVIMMRQLVKHRVETSPPDLMITPKLPADITLFNGFTNLELIIAQGQKAAEAALPQIGRLLERQSNLSCRDDCYQAAGDYPRITAEQ